jgi:hypothetical protein
MSEWSKEPVLKTGDVKASVGSNPTLSAKITEILVFWRRMKYHNLISIVFGLEKYPSGRRGSPAKGVVRDERSEGSNPSFSAKNPQSIEISMLCGFFICCCFINKNVAYGEQISLATNLVNNTLIDLLPTLLPTSISLFIPIIRPVNY